MYQTIRVSSCVSVQGELVRLLANGEVLIRDVRKVYRGRPVVAALPPTVIPMAPSPAPNVEE